jgi:hypothetical protein
MHAAWKVVLGGVVALVLAVLAGAVSGSAQTAASQASPVKVVAGGVTQVGEGMGVGVVLKNTSKQDALRVDVTFFAVTSSGAPVSVGQTTVDLVPAGATYYTGDELKAIAPGRTATKLEAYIKVDELVPARYHLPLVDKVVVTKGSSQTIVRGRLKNTLKGTLADMARIGIVLFDKGGKVVGGTYTYPRHNVPKGKAVSWETTMPLLGNVASAKATAENAGLNNKPVAG